jgi:hypothetical protein
MRLAGQTGYGATVNGGPLFEGPNSAPIGEQILPYMNAFTQGVVDPTRAEFDHLRGLASRGTSDAAIRANSFGGSRHGVAEGVRLGELDRAQATTIADLNRQGYDSAMAYGLPHIEQQRQLRERMLQEPMFRHGQGMNMLNLGMGPTGSVQTQETEQGWGSQLMGGLLTAASFIPGPQQPFAMAAQGLNQMNRSPSSGYQSYGTRSPGMPGGIQHFNLNSLYGR